MARGWILSPVVGAGTHESPITAQVEGRERQDGDRLEFVIGDRDLCLVAYDVADDSNLPDFGGMPLGGLDGDEAVLPLAQRRELRRLAQELGVGDRGTVRQVLRRIGVAIAGPHFHEDLHLTTSPAPPAGSFVSDSFTDTNGTTLASHTGETGR